MSTATGTLRGSNPFANADLNAACANFLEAFLFGSLPGTSVDFGGSKTADNGTSGISSSAGHRKGNLVESPRIATRKNLARL
eukprot:6377873-Karenia_brevis.AAC.1